MSDSNNPNNTNSSSGSPPSARRGSFASQALQDLFGTNRTRLSWSGAPDQSATRSNNTTATFPGPITTAAAQASQRRMSTSAVGLNKDNNPNSPLSGFKRSESVSSNTSNVIDESAVEDGEPLSQSSPGTPFARRMSFGARALRDVRTSTGGVGNTAGRSSYADTGVSAGTGSEQKKTTPPMSKARDGYNWADSFRSRAERSSSIASVGNSPNTNHVRSKSIATMQPPPVQPQAPKPMVPDHVQERILKGDFYMD